MWTLYRCKAFSIPRAAPHCWWDSPHSNLKRVVKHWNQSCWGEVIWRDPNKWTIWSDARELLNQRPRFPNVMATNCVTWNFGAEWKSCFNCFFILPTFHFPFLSPLSHLLHPPLPKPSCPCEWTTLSWNPSVLKLNKLFARIKADFPDQLSVVTEESINYWEESRKRIFLVKL